MNTYLLLRNNKESGPYTTQQLIQFGFKPYDLVWAEGKSAAWRYPSELAEFKGHAPEVEEQPFDRFYKKKVEIKPDQPGEIETEAEVEEIKTVQREITSGSVFVSLPNTKVIQKKEMVAAKVEMPISQPLSAPNTINEKLNSEEKNNQRIDEFKKEYSQNYERRKTKQHKWQILSSGLRYAAAAAFVIIAGTLIYFTMKPGSPIEPVTKPTLVIGNNQAIQESTVQNEVPGPEQNTITDTEIKDEISTPVLTPPVIKKTPSNIKSNKPALKETKVPPAVEQETEILSEAPGTINQNGQRMSLTRNGSGTESAITANANLNNLVKLKVNDYKRKVFGGIQDLELSIVNNSGYILDNVEVELHYLKPSELVLKTEMIHFSNIAPNGSMTKKIPDSQRGIKVTYEIKNIESSQYDKSLAGN